MSPRSCRVNESAPRALAVTAIGALMALGAGCEPVGEGGYDQPYSVKKPAHPAMTAPVSTVGQSRPVNPHGHGTLPPSHPPIPQKPSSSPPPGAAAASGPEMEFLGLKATAPDGWVRGTPSNRMRLAQFSLPHADGDEYDGELTVIPAMGSVQGNVDRWEGQFEGSPQAVMQDREIAGLKVMYVTIDGTFIHKSRPMAPGPGTPRPDYKLIGAVVQAPEGQLFFKSWGPRATMEKWLTSFDELLNSFRPSR